ncbi:MAG TPA: hypothetical protein VFW07_04905 [Parafilimonas sp.]|nr:hypothetical protein [Parafilimonas sp.]
MISTKNPEALPDRNRLQNICKSISVLDAIISQDWEYRYYSYNSKWSKNEEVFEMRNGQGDQMLILFAENGCIINGFDHEVKKKNKQKLTYNLPQIFQAFMFEEPISSIGTTFCIWSIQSKNWQLGEIQDFDDGSERLLNIFDNNPQTYIDWATDYFEESYNENGIPFETVKKIYDGKSLTKEMVLSIVDELEDWKQLENDLIKIGYPYNFSE